MERGDKVRFLGRKSEIGQLLKRPRKGETLLVVEVLAQHPPAVWVEDRKVRRYAIYLADLELLCGRRPNWMIRRCRHWERRRGDESC